TAPPRVEWSGWAIQPAYTDTQLELTCDPNSPHGDAVNQGAKWQRACFKTGYSPGERGCNLPADGYRVPGTLTAVAGVELPADEFASPRRTFVGGYVEWPDPLDPAVTQRRAI